MSFSPPSSFSLSLCLSSPGCVYWKHTRADTREAKSLSSQSSQSGGETDRQMGGTQEALGTEGASKPEAG